MVRFHPQWRRARELVRLGGALRIEDQLRQSFAIAQIDKYHAAVIPPAVRPAAKSHALADQRFVKFTAIMTAHA